MRSALLGIIFLLLPVPAAAYSGNELYGMCGHYPDFESDEALTEYAVCIGYIRGVVDMAAAAKLFCWPAGATGEQINDVVYRWLNTHPERRHEGAYRLVVAALAEAFPCQQ